MRPQKQLHRHRPDQGEWGDCFRTAVACLLDLDAVEVPHVFDNGAGEEGFAVMDDWLAERGYVLIAVAYSGDVPLADVFAAQQHYNPGIPFLLSGRSSNNVNHVIVCCDGGVVCDPSQDESGIVGPPTTGLWWIEYLGRKL